MITGITVSILHHFVLPFLQVHCPKREQTACSYSPFTEKSRWAETPGIHFIVIKIFVCVISSDQHYKISKLHIRQTLYMYLQIELSSAMTLSQEYLYCFRDSVNCSPLKNMEYFQPRRIFISLLCRFPRWNKYP